MEKENQQKGYILNFMKNNLEEIKNKIQQAFGKYTFIENGHYYLCNGKRVGISTTGLIGQYEQKFDKDTISQMVANKRGISQQEVLEEWRIENLHSTIKGSFIHEFAQSLWEGKEYKFDYSNVPKEIDLDKLKSDIEKLIPQAINFYNDYKDMYELIGCEIYLGDEDFDECGATDQMMLNKYTGGITIIDYKTNKKIEYESYKHKKMLVPLHKFDDCNYIHYSFQLGDYKFKFEKNTNLKVDETFIVYFNVNADNYEIIEPLNMEKEVEDILEIRRVKNMKSIPVLIMGASGTGKSFSFRNLPPEETAIISVAKSELPFRNKTGLKFVECDDYTKIASAIQNTKKRIICLDDSGYLMQFENFDKAMIKGYDKHTEMAKHYADLLKVIRKLDGEKIVYMTIHEDVIEGIAKPKTTGKMINDNLCIEGLLNIVFRSVIKEGEHVFQTRSAGDSVAKTPYEMYEEEFIPNDLAEIDKNIREFYGFKPITEKLEEKKEEEK